MRQRKSPVRTPALLAANRANARLSTGPRTREGRRRSALNRRPMRFSFMLRAKGQDDRDVLRLWRDLMVQFWFVKALHQRRPRRFERARELQCCLERLAWAWWRKLKWIGMGASKEDLASSNRWIEGDLWSFLFEFRVLNRKADDWLRKQFSSDGRACMAPLREAIEARLGAFRELERSNIGKHRLADRAQESLAGVASCAAQPAVPVVPPVIEPPRRGSGAPSFKPGAAGT